MLNEITDNIRLLGPVFIGVWILTIVSTALRPQRFFNSILLIISLMITILFASGFFGEDKATFLLISFLFVTAVLFTVPVLLIANGIQMICRESVCPAHLLSLGLGIFVGIGEIATVVYALNLSGSIEIGQADLLIMFIAFTVFYFSFLVLCFVIYSVFIQIMPHRMDFDYVIIHGCGLAGGERLTKLLSARVDKAIEVYKKCRTKPTIIPSGGQGSDEKLSEAQAMKDYLISHGVPEESILPEDRSTTTFENLAFSKEIIDSGKGGKKTALISSNYHVYRCLRLAKKAGLRCTGIGAHTALYYWPSALIREFIAVFLTKRFMIWSFVGYLFFISPVLFAWITR